MSKKRGNGGCAACTWVAEHGSTKLGTGEIGHTCGSYESPLQRSLRPVNLSARARNVLVMLTEVDHYKKRKREVSLKGLSEVELLRRAANIDPPLSYDMLTKRVARCGAATAREVCVAMGLPVQPDKLTHRVQCPRCGHVFGGGK